jgi:hypothetical protein
MENPNIAQSLDEIIAKQRKPRRGRNVNSGGITKRYNHPAPRRGRNVNSGGITKRYNHPAPRTVQKSPKPESEVIITGLVSS